MKMYDHHIVVLHNSVRGLKGFRPLTNHGCRTRHDKIPAGSKIMVLIIEEHGGGGGATQPFRAKHRVENRRRLQHQSHEAVRAVGFRTITNCGMSDQLQHAP